MRLMKAVAAISLAVGAASTWAGPALTFEGIADLAAITDQYSKSHGIVFSGDALAIRSDGALGNLRNLPSPVTALGLSGSELRIDITDGFKSNLGFWYSSNQASGTVTLFDDKANVLDSFDLASVEQTRCKDEAGIFCEWDAVDFDFTGTAYTVLISGGSFELYFDDMVFGAAAPPTDVPEPASLGLVAAGFGAALLSTRRRRRG